MSDRLAIKIKSLGVTYGSGKNATKAVEDFDLDIESGEIFGLLGPNGAGKSSIISTLTGLLELKQGEVEIFGHRAGSLEAKSYVGVVPQELVHHGYFTVNEILNFFSGYYGIANNQKRIDYLLDRLALTDKKHKNVSQLSGGMKRRLLIAKALVHSPQLLLLDEPSAGVDVELRTLLWNFVEELNEQGATILLTTHYLEEAQRLCHRVAIMSHGKLLAVDGTGHMIQSLAQRLLKLTLCSSSRIETLQEGRIKEGVVLLKKSGANLELKVAGEVTIKEALDAISVPIEDVQDIQMEEGALEEAFLKIVQEDETTRNKAVARGATS